ncbi:MAG: YbaY family lipoprotein [Rhodanobacter sp.]|jgi:putative lipoprotein|nr:YbaY family lipoprotein [Rhodanobacter sp.]
MRRVALFLIILAVLAITACRSTPPSPSAPPQKQENTPPATAATQIHGRASYLERMALPAQSVLEVQMIADDANPPVPIVQTSFGDLHGPPFDFSLTYDPATIKPDAHYSLRAALRDAQGHLQFLTPQSVAVTPGSDHVVEFQLVRASVGQSP